MKVIRKTISLLLAGVLLFSMLQTVLAEEIIIQDKISGASYMLPDSWTIDSTVDNNKEFRITCTTETDGYFYCSSMDTWASLDEQSKAAYSNNRSNVNNTIFTPRLIAQLFGWEPDKVSLEAYGNHSFFVYDRSEKISGRDYRWTSLLTYWNGYFTNISLVVPPYDIVSMAELKKFLDSFKYPGEEPAEKPADADHQRGIGRFLRFPAADQQHARAGCDRYQPVLSARRIPVRGTPQGSFRDRKEKP